jgi:hypothetical protein
MPRELRAALVAAILVAAVAWWAGSLNRKPARDPDPRASTLLTGPSGARGIATTLEALGTRVVRLRAPLATALPPSQVDSGALLLVLDPMSRSGVRASAALAGRHAEHDLLLAGGGSDGALQCLGWKRRALGDSLPIVARGVPAGSRPPAWSRAVLEPVAGPASVLRGGVADDADVTCTLPVPQRTDTLLAMADGRPVAIRLGFGRGRTTTLVAEGNLFRNERARATQAGVLAVSLIGERRLVYVDEFVHGFDDGRDLAGVALAWAAGRPTGVAVLHLALAGIVLLLTWSVRRAPPRPLPSPPRRSAAEHVEALAGALAAAGGRATAVRLLVRGLRRRLGESGAAMAREPDAAWLARQQVETADADARSALATLGDALVEPTESAVLGAARAAETFHAALRR